MTGVSMDAATELIADDAARQRALELASFIVEAPAGAGKTELLTQRYLRLLVTVDAPEEVLAITFTQKAAIEMRQRIMRSLQGAESGVAPKEAHRQQTWRLAGDVLRVSQARGWGLLEQPGRLRILTIDALCAGISRQMPLLSRFGTQPAVINDPKPLYEEAVRQTLALLEDANPLLSGPVADSLAYLDNDFSRLSDLLCHMLERRDQWLQPLLPHFSLPRASDDALAGLVAAELAETAALLPANWLARFMPLARFAADTLIASGKDSPINALLDWQEPLPADPAALLQWLGLVELLLTQKGEWRKSFTVAIGLPAGKVGQPWKELLAALIAELSASTRAGVAAALHDIRSLPSLADRSDEDAIVQTFVGLLKLAAANLWQVFRAQGACDFVEVAQGALQALADERGPTDLALRLDYRIQHLLVDEFQDTSPTQIELLKRLTAGWSEGDGRTLFCVGDPMQSIYRFRKADVGLFLRAAQRGIGSIALEPLRLYRNNRSCREVVDWINASFGAIFPDADHIARGAISYRPFVATRSDLPAAGVFVHPLRVAETAGAEAVGRIEAQRMLAVIDDVWRQDASREIAVLVRSRRHLVPLVSEIRRCRPDLRFQAVDVEPLAGRQWIEDLLSLTRALLHRADRVSWLAVLRSPLCGLTLSDLYAVAGGESGTSSKTTVWSRVLQADQGEGLSADGAQRLAVFRRVLAAAFSQRGRLRLARWIEDTWFALGGPATLPDSGAAQDVEACFALIESLDAGVGFSLDRLPAEIDRLFAAPDPAADGRLKLMTIHKAKGLEFDTVLLPGLARKVDGNATHLLCWEEVVRDDGSAGMVVAPVSPRQNTEAGPTAYRYLQRLEAERAGNEDLRVLYVAATRAVRALHLFAVVKVDAEPGEVKVPAGTPLGALWPVVKPEFLSVGDVVDASFAQSSSLRWEDFVPPMLRQPTAAYGAAGSTGSNMAKGAAPDAKRAVDLFDSVSGTPGARTAAAVGTLVHRYLEHIAGQALDEWTARRFESLQASMQYFLRQQGLSRDEAARGAITVKTVLLRVLASPAGRWLLEPHPQAAAELALKASAGIAVVDRTFVIDGERWIVDYKTGVIADSSSIDELKRQAEIHRPQLERYAALFAAQALPLRLAVFFTDIAKMVELSS